MIHGCLHGGYRKDRGRLRSLACAASRSGYLRRREHAGAEESRAVGAGWLGVTTLAVREFVPFVRLPRDDRMIPKVLGDLARQMG
jgi:hypothetical protein